MALKIESTSNNHIGDYLEDEWTVPSAAMTTGQIAENIEELATIINLLLANVEFAQDGLDEFSEWIENKHPNNNGYRTPSMDMYNEDDTKLHAGTGSIETDADTIEVVDFGRSNFGSTGNQIIQ